MVRKNGHAVSNPVSSRVERAIEEYLNARGILDTDEWLSRFPDCTAELLEFLGNQSQISSLMAAFGCAAVVTDCRIGEYEILEILDRGGMGIVYKARHRKLHRIVALKMIHQGQFRSPEMRRRFQNEAETVARFRHPNLVAIHEVGEHNGIPFFSMEYVQGRTLSDLRRQGRIRPQVVAQITQTIAETIHYIHGCGVLHRDLKPSNVMIDQNSDVRITDFGLAKQLDRDYSLTETGQILGSIDYMPPEQAEARHELMGPASDVYSIGAILFELLTGRPPFRNDTFLETLRQIREQDPVRPSQLNPRVPADLDAICIKCLQKKPSRRYASAMDLSQELQRYLNDEPVMVRKRFQPPQLFRSFWARTSAAVCLTGAITGLTLASTFSDPYNPSPVTRPAIVQGADSVPPQPAEQQPVPPQAVEPQPLQQPPAPEAIARIEIPAEQEQNPPAAPADAFALPVLSAIGVAGQPFGVAQIEFQIDKDCDWGYRADKPMRFVSDGGKAFYGAFQYRAARPATKNRQAENARLNAWFLFEGNQPAAVTLVSGDDVLARNVQVRTDEPGRTHKSLLTSWWSSFGKNKLPHTSPELGSVNDYILTMLAGRLKLPAPLLSTRHKTGAQLEVEFERTFGMLFGFESIRLAMMSGETASPRQTREAATLNLPQRLSIPSVRIPPLIKPIDIEPIAMRIPEECFYLRCFRVSNYLWVRGLVKGWGGDMDGVVATPGADYHVRDRIEAQLGLDIPSLIDAGIDDELTDCALIGLDPFFHDGPAIGVLFEGKRDGRLDQILKSARKRVAENAGIEEASLLMGARTAKVIQTSRHQVRSYYVTSGDYHLITNSETLASRFLQADAGEKSLGRLQEYAYARQEASNERNCAAWLYLPDPFFRNITSPEYRIELQRRRQAKQDLVSLSLARIASEAETGQAMEVGELVQKGFLPNHFGVRPDLSKAMFSEGSVCDSVRGVPGTFVPIADVKMAKCTSFESRSYEEFKTSYQREWRSMDPVLLSFHSMPSKVEGCEKVLLSIRITPYAQQEYQFLRQYLERVPGKQRVERATDELLGVSAQLSSAGQRPWAQAGLVDEQVPFELKDGRILRTGNNADKPFSKSNAFALITDPTDSAAFLLADFVSVLKTRKSMDLASPQPQSSLLGSLVNVFFPIQEMINSAIARYSTTSNKARVMTDNKALAQRVLNEYRIETTERPAHLFMHMKNISEARVFPYIRAWTYMSSRQASAADTATINRVSDLLQTEPVKMKAQLEHSFGAILTCPTGGNYEATPSLHRPPYFVSTSWKRPSLFDETEVPEEYQFPFLQWLHGMELECSLNAVTLESRLEIEIQSSDRPTFKPISGVAAVSR